MVKTGNWGQCNNGGIKQNEVNKYSKGNVHLKAFRGTTCNQLWIEQNLMELLFIWELMMRQQKQKGLKSFVEFKSLIKNWKSSNCPFRLCKDHIPQVGFVNLTQ